MRRKQRRKRGFLKTLALILGGSFAFVSLFSFLPMSVPDKASAEGISDGHFNSPPIEYPLSPSYMTPSLGGAIISRLTRNFDTITMTIPNLVCPNDSYVSYIGNGSDTYFSDTSTSSSYNVTSRSYSYDFHSYSSTLDGPIVLFSVDVRDVIVPYHGLLAFFNYLMNQTFNLTNTDSGTIALNYSLRLDMFAEETDTVDGLDYVYPISRCFVDYSQDYVVDAGDTFKSTVSYPSITSDFVPFTVYTNGVEYCFIDRAFFTFSLVNANLSYIGFSFSSACSFPLSVYSSEYFSAVSTLFRLSASSSTFSDLFNHFFNKYITLLPQYESLLSDFSVLKNDFDKLQADYDNLSLSFSPGAVIFNTVEDILNIELFPNFKLSTFIMISVGALILGFVIKMFLGG